MNLLSSYSVHLQVCAPTFFGRARCTINISRQLLPISGSCGWGRKAVGEGR